MLALLAEGRVAFRMAYLSVPLRTGATHAVGATWGIKHPTGGGRGLPVDADAQTQLLPQPSAFVQPKKMQNCKGGTLIGLGLALLACV